MSITERERIAARRRRTLVRLLTVQPQDAANENEAAEPFVFVRCPADWGNAMEGQRCTLHEEHDGNHRSATREWPKDDLDEAAETRVYGCLHSTFDEHDRCVECGAAEVSGPSSVSVPWHENCMDLHGDDRTRTPHRHVEGGPGRPISGPSSVSSADVVWSWDHTAAMGLAEMTNAAMRRIEEAVQR